VLPSRFLLSFIIASAVLTTHTPLLAQEDDLEATVESADVDGSDENALLDELDEYRRDPIPLYNTTADQLARLPEITLRDAEAILRYVEENAPAAMTQLDSLPGITRKKMSMLRRYTTLKRSRSRESMEDFTVEVRSRVAIDLQQRRGYRDSLMRQMIVRDPATNDSLGLDTVNLGPTYLGSPLGFMTRVLLRKGVYSGGIVVEKDPGEPLLLNDTVERTYGRYELVDPAIAAATIETRFGGFVSAHAQAALGPVTINVGDYTAEFGQGLVLGGSLGGVKGADVLKAPVKAARGIASYRSAGEARFFRGAAVAFNEEGWLPEGWSAALLASHRQLDATVQTMTRTADEDPLRFVGSIREDGYHRTHGEIRGSGTLDETLFGGTLRWRSLEGQIGLTAYHTRFSDPFVGDLPGEFSGDHATMIGVDGRWQFGQTILFGEMARSEGNAMGALGGVQTRLGSLDLVVAGRVLPADFSTPHGSGFGESPDQQRNEQGFYLGARASVAPGAVLSAYLDLYRNPERSFSVPLPRSGVDAFLELDYVPARSFALTVRLRSERKGEASTIPDAFDRDRKRLIDKTTSSGRIEARYTPALPGVQVRARVERRVVDYSAGAPQAAGLLTFLDIRYAPTEILSFGTRLTLFSTSSYDARIYELEQDLPGRLTSLALSGEGRRLYLMGRWKAAETIGVSLRYAETVYTDRDVVSAGSSQQIDGPITSSLTLQFDATF